MIARLLIVLVALAAVFGGIFGWKQHQAERRAAAMSGPPQPATVAAARARSERWETELFAVGSVVASQGVHVNNEVPGQVLAIRFASGQQVERGAPLVQLDDRVDRATLQGLLAEQRLAAVDFERAAELLGQRTISRADYDKAQAELDNARARVAAERARIEQKEIRAPFAGRLGIRLVDLGEYLPAGSRVVLLQALDPVHVDYSLPERHFAALEVGQRVAVRVQSWPGDSFLGRISAINPGVDPGTRTVRVRATVNNAGRRLRPGMFAETRTRLGRERDVITVPRTAISFNPYGDAVWVIEDEEDGLTVARRQVDTGETRAGRTEIVSGLEAGERIVSAGGVKLRNGQRVRVDDSVDHATGTGAP